MERVEFLDKLNELNYQLRKLKDQYITSNTTIPPGNYVMVTCNGITNKYYLKDYKIVNGYIQPVFNRCYKDKRGVPHIDFSNEQFSNNITMELV